MEAEPVESQHSSADQFLRQSPQKQSQPIEEVEELEVDSILKQAADVEEGDVQSEDISDISEQIL